MFLLKKILIFVTLSISVLNLGNPFTKIHLSADEHYSFLREIYISQTNLTILTSKDFEPFPALQHLYLVQNRISRISPGAFNNLQNLLTLDLSVNELELLPKERLQGLKSLRCLNISHNSLRSFEEFTSELGLLKVLDVSFNQLDHIEKGTFRHLISLTELHLMGNRVTAIASDAFKYLNGLHVLDLRRNYFEQIPLRALKPLETHIKTIKIEGLYCICFTNKFVFAAFNSEQLCGNQTKYFLCLN